MSRLFSHPRKAAALITGALLSACTTTTTVMISPPDQAPICQPQSGLKTAVLWRTNWRPNQKDIPEREAAASEGIVDFFADSRCFLSTSVARARTDRAATEVPYGSDLLLVLTVRELGPTVKLLSSPALVEGYTEVVVDVARYLPGRIESDRQFSIHWRNGGPRVVKGVQSLPADMTAALKAGLQEKQDHSATTKTK
ncbi:MAG: hypothetical protein WC765_08500 [Phycisphaerae bacterium]|jgi:hypothetical protein